MRAEFKGVFQCANEGGVFGLVVGRLAEAVGLLDGFLALAVDDVGEGGRARIAADAPSV